MRNVKSVNQKYRGKKNASAFGAVGALPNIDATDMDNQETAAASRSMTAFGSVISNRLRGSEMLK